MAHTSRPTGPPLPVGGLSFVKERHMTTPTSEPDEEPSHPDETPDDEPESYETPRAS